MRLPGLIGNESLKRSLAAMERPPHAVIISGPKGSGRHTLARLLAQAHVCTGREIPCGVCPDCRRAAEGIHPDVMDLRTFVPESDLNKDVKVSTIRDIRSDAQIAPNQAGRKVYLIDQPINLPAQNAMLKLLEEGPPYAAFVMITENSASLLETVRSRCAQLRTGPVTQAQAVNFLRERFPQQDQNALSQAAEVAQGILGRGIELLEAGTQNDDTAPYTERWLNALLRRSELALMECVAEVQTKKISRETAEQLWLTLGQAFRQALLVCAGAEADSEQARMLAQTFSRSQLLEFYDLIQQVRDMGTYNVPPAHSAGWLAVRLAVSCR